MTAAPGPDRLSEAEALQRLHAARPDARLWHWWGHRFGDGWFITFAPGTRAPFGAPSWIVLDSGTVSAAHSHETFEQAMDRAQAVQSAPVPAPVTAPVPPEAPASAGTARPARPRAQRPGRGRKAPMSRP